MPSDTHPLALLATPELLEHEMLTPQDRGFSLGQPRDVEPNLPAAAQAQIGRRLRAHLPVQAEGDLPTALRDAMVALEARFADDR